MLQIITLSSTDFYRIIGTQLLRQPVGGLLQRLQSGPNFLFALGVLADRLSHNDLQVGIDANLGIVGVLEVALFAHDASLGIGKADLFFSVNGFARVKLFFALLKGLFGRFDFSQPVLNCKSSGIS